MTEQTPMDLRALGDVDSPEVIREAVRRFRRRTLRMVAWVLLAAVAIGSTILAKSVNESLTDRINKAPGGVAPGTVYHVARMTAILAKVVSLGGATGFHVIVVQPRTGPQYSSGVDDYMVDAPDGASQEPRGHEPDAGIYDLWFSVRVPAAGRLTLRVDLQCSPLPSQINAHGFGSCSIGPPYPEIKPIVIDLPSLGVPGSIWRKGASS